jgi:hypothetical protein
MRYTLHFKHPIQPSSKNEATLLEHFDNVPTIMQISSVNPMILFVAILRPVPKSA